MGGPGGPDLGELGREVGLLHLGGDVGHQGLVPILEELHEHVPAALAERVVDVDQRDLLGLEVVGDPLDQLGEPDLLAEGRQEDVRVALGDDEHRLGAADLRDARLAGELHVGHRGGAVHRAHDGERALVDGPADHRHRRRRIGLGVHDERLEGLSEDAALLVDLLRAEDDAVPHRPRRRAATGDLGHDGELDGAWPGAGSADARAA